MRLLRAPTAELAESIKFTLLPIVVPVAIFTSPEQSHRIFSALIQTPALWKDVRNAWTTLILWASTEPTAAEVESVFLELDAMFVASRDAFVSVYCVGKASSPPSPASSPLRD